MLIKKYIVTEEGTMHTKSSLRQLRDNIFESRKNQPYQGGSVSKTASYVYDIIAIYNEPKDIFIQMRNDATQALGLPLDPNSDTDFVLAYNLVFGDISTAPLHINDALEPVAKWRMEQPFECFDLLASNP